MVQLSAVADLVAEALGSNDGDLIADALVGLEVESETGVVPLNDDLGGLLDGLGTNATHFGGIGLMLVVSERSVARFPPSENLVVSSACCGGANWLGLELLARA